MTHCTVLFLLFSSGAFLQGLNAQVRTIAVKVGGEAFLNCDLMKSEDVVQVTWQKISPEISLATNSKYWNPRVNPQFSDKVEFKDAGLQNSSIIIRNVKQQDEGCYNCVFNIQNHGAISCETCETCLQVYELNEPILHVSESSSTAEFIVSCSATGRPAPTVTLSSVQGQNFSHSSTVRVPNTNGTMTVNTTAVLSALHRNSTRVRCSVRLAFVSKTEVFTTIPGFDEERSPSDSDDSKFSPRGLNLLPSLVVLVFAVAAVIFLIIKKHKKSLSHSDPEKNEDKEVGTELRHSRNTTDQNTTDQNAINQTTAQGGE